MLEEAADELVDLQVGASGTSRFRVLPSEGDAVSVEGFDAVIADSNSEDVASKIKQRVTAVADMFCMNDPVSSPDLLGDMVLETGLCKSIANLGTEDDLESISGYEEPWVCWLDPGRAIRSEPSGSDEDVDMGVKDQSARPRMEDSKDGEAAADILWIGSELEQALGSRTDEDVVRDSLMRSRQGPEFFGYRKREQEVAAWQEQLAAFLEPTVGPASLTRWAMTVAAGVIGMLNGTARITAIEVPTKIR